MSTRKVPALGFVRCRTGASAPELIFYNPENEARVTAINLDRLDPELREATVRGLAIGSYPVAPREAMVVTGTPTTPTPASLGAGNWVLSFIGWAGLTALVSGFLSSLLASMLGWYTDLVNLTGNVAALIGGVIALTATTTAFRNRTVAVPLNDAIEADVPVSLLGNDLRSYVHRVQEALLRLVKEKPEALNADIWLGCYQAQADAAVIHELRLLNDNEATARARQLLARTSAFADLIETLVRQEIDHPQELARSAATSADIRRRLSRYLGVEPSGNYLELGPAGTGFEGYPGAGVYEPAELPSRSTAKPVGAVMLAAVSEVLGKTKGRQ